MYYFPRRDPEPVQPNGHTFELWLGDGASLTVWISREAVNIAYKDYKIDEHKPLWTAFYLLSENPALEALYHPRFGWDFVKLIGLMRGEIAKMMTLDLRDERLREQLGLRTVSVPSQKPPRQEKRPAEQTLQLIQDYVRDNPNCTRLQIASGLNRKKSPYIIAQIEWLVHAGVLARTHIVRPEGTIEWRYIFVGDNEN